MERRRFLKGALAIGSGLLVPVSCSVPARKKNWTLQLSGPDATSGHRLRKEDFPEISQEESVDVLIVGAGVSGLTAAWHLQKAGITKVILLEMESVAGGNARSGSNDVGVYPYGAHYLPVPSLENKPLLAFLLEIGVIREMKNEIPAYEDVFLCLDPNERLFIKNRWQEGLLPKQSLSNSEKAEISRFVALMEEWKQKKGSDEKWAFDIPASYSSKDKDFQLLDQLSFEEYLRKQNFTYHALFWYINYCCLDDYGIPARDCSAWAGIHYFAARRGKASNADSEDVLTWPEGNQFLVARLAEPLKGKIRTRQMAYSVKHKENYIETSVLDIAKNTSIRYKSRHLVLACPPRLSCILLGWPKMRSVHSPWLVANLTVNTGFCQERGMPLSWDNVCYGSTSLGYVHAGHQHLHQISEKTILTFYLPLAALEKYKDRHSVANESPENWAKLVLSEMKKMHYFIEEYLISIELWIWGHAMVAPVTGSLFPKPEENGMEPLPSGVVLAHSDLAGYSVFEEAFHQGHQAALHIQSTYDSKLDSEQTL